MRYFNFKFFSLFLIIFLFTSKTVFAGFNGKVTAEAVTAVETALTKTGALKGAGHAEALEKAFRASTAAHRLRLSEIFTQLQKNPDFVKKFPEYAELAKNPSRTIESLLLHDAGKADPDANLAVKALSLLQGYDFRSRNANLPEDVDKLVRKVLKDAIDDVNEVEKKYVMHGTSFDDRVNSLAEVLDYYDTYKSRQSEIARDGRKLKGPSEWLDFLSKGENLTEEAAKELTEKKRFATYLEQLDPLKNKLAFTQAADVLKKVGSNISADVATYFARGSEKLMAIRGVSNARKVISMAGKATRRLPLAGAAITAADYLIEPEHFSVQKTIEDTVVGMTLTGETSSCASPNCVQFISDCGKRNGAKNPYAFAEVTQDKKFSYCVSDFFKLPLDKQSDLRTDTDLNNLLMAFAPQVTSIRCEVSNKSLKAEIQTFGESREMQSQVLQFNKAGEPALATRLPEKMDQIQFEGRLASQLRHCSSVRGCEQFKMETVKDEKPYFWKDQDSIVPDSWVTKIPTEAFTWAKGNGAFLEMQSRNIKDCCGNKDCRKNLDVARFQRPQQQRIPAASHSEAVQAQR